jgi:hypothetical protein
MWEKELLTKFGQSHAIKSASMYGSKLVTCKPDIKEDDSVLTPRSHSDISIDYDKSPTNASKEARQAKKKELVTKFPNHYNNCTSNFIFPTYEENEPVS